MISSNGLPMGAKKNKIVATFVASAVVPTVNTALFIVGCLFMTNSIYPMAPGQNVLAFILVSIVTFNFFIELAVNLLVAPSLFRVVRAFDRSYSEDE